LRWTGNLLGALGTAAVSAVSALARGIAGVSSSIAKSVSTPSPASTPAPVSPGLSLSAGTTLLGAATSPAIASAVLASGTTSTVSPTPAPSGGRTKPAPNPTPGEIVSARTGNSRTFDNGNGTRTVELGQNLNFQSAPGQYSPVNLAFHQVGASMVEDGSQVTVKAATGTIDVTDRTSGVGLRWSTAGAATVSGTAVSVSSPGLSWTYSPTGSGLELSTLVSARRGPQTYTFNYSLLGGAQALSVDGQGELTSTAFAVSRPVVVGANGHVYQAGAWQITAPGQAQFAWDDSSLPANALPYVLDPAQYYFNTANLDESFLANGYPAGGIYSYAPNNPAG
jgi:hypothetical protein